MHLHSVRLKNFRRLKDVHIELAPDISIFVGANNSAKTSATQAIEIFAHGSKDKLSIYDFGSHCWSIFNHLGDRPSDTETSVEFPAIFLDLWFEVQSRDLHRAIDLLPSLDWCGSQVGLRVAFEPKNVDELLANYREAKAKAVGQVASMQNRAGNYLPWPKNLVDYLGKELRREYEFRYYVLDQARFDKDFNQGAEYTPLQLTSEKGAAEHKSFSL